MTNPPPSEPKSSQETALGFDDFIGILVAFVTIGAILFWSFSRRNSSVDLTRLLSPHPTPSGNVQPNQNPNLSPLPLLSPSPPADFQPNLGSKPTDSTSPAVEPTESPSPSPSIAATPDTMLPLVPKTTPSNSPQVQTPSPRNAQSQPKPVPLVTPSIKKPTIPPPIAFRDVPNEYWARPFIDVLSSRDIVKGFPDNSFRPNQPVTRAEFAAILQQAFDKELAKEPIEFLDVIPKFWATPAIDQAVRTGFLKGYPDNTFRPDQRIPRVQVLVALVSGLKLKSPSSQAKVLSIYKDGKKIPRYAIDKTAIATRRSLVVNYPDPKLLNPNREATRAEVATMVHQALVQMGRLQPISSPNIVRLRNSSGGKSPNKPASVKPSPVKRTQKR